MVNREDFGPFIAMTERIGQVRQRFSNEFAARSADAMISTFVARLRTFIGLDESFSLLSKYLPLITNFEPKLAAFTF